jgi:MOB kinase activator 1
MLFRYEYLWADGKKIKKPIQVSAEEYANYLMTWVQGIFQDETVFPVNDGMSYNITSNQLNRYSIP